jgi:PAS domain S-box-containing protein
MDANLRIATWNPAAETLYGWSEEEMIGQDLYERVPSEYVDTTWQEFMDDFWETGHWKGEVIRTRKDGRRVHVLVSVTGIRDENGKIVASVGINTDITVIKEAEQHRLDLMRERERVDILQRFVGDATHDLNTPLTNIRSSLYLLSRSTEQSKRDKHMTALAVQTEKLDKLLDNMLSMARLDDPATAELQIVSQDINRIIKGVAVQLAPTIERKRHHVGFDLHDDLPQVMVDRGEIMRALEEILLNAIGYTPDGGQITLRTLPEGDFVTVEFQDNGIGISKEDLPHIFDRFFRADPARSSETGGSGLGLSFARKMVEAHGGQIMVNSSPGQGSIFRVLLPIHEG